MQAPRRKSEELKKRDDGPIHLTEEGFKRLKEKLARLRSNLPGFIAETQRTAAYGDRSDNAEYKDAKSNLRRTNWRILEIKDQIKRVLIIPSGPNSSHTVQIGSTVVLEVDGDQKTFQILGSYETNPTKGRISFNSPLGSALLNHKKDDAVTIKTPSGTKEYEIIEIR